MWYFADGPRRLWPARETCCIFASPKIGFHSVPFFFRLHDGYLGLASLSTCTSSSLKDSVVSVVPSFCRPCLHWQAVLCRIGEQATDRTAVSSCNGNCCPRFAAILPLHDTQSFLQSTAAAPQTIWGLRSFRCKLCHSLRIRKGRRSKISRLHTSLRCKKKCLKIMQAQIATFATLYIL